MTLEQFFETLTKRLLAGAREYGNRSFLKPVHETERQINEEQIDEVGWLFVLWVQATRKLPQFVSDLDSLMTEWNRRLKHRAMRNDRGMLRAPYDNGAEHLMHDIEILAVDLMQQHVQTSHRLSAICRALEVAPKQKPHRPYPGRHNSYSQE